MYNILSQCCPFLLIFALKNEWEKIDSIGFWERRVRMVWFAFSIFFSSSQNHFFFSLKKLFLLSRWHPINLNSFSSFSLAQEARPTFWGRIIHYDLEEFWHFIPKENVEFPKMWLHRAYLLNLHLKYSSFFPLVAYL